MGLNLPARAQTALIGGINPPIPQSLPIGKNWATDGLNINVGVGNTKEVDGWLLGGSVGTNFLYDQSMGLIEFAAKNAIAKLAPTFVPPKGTENWDWWVALDVSKFFGTPADMTVVYNMDFVPFQPVVDKGVLTIPPEFFAGMKVYYQSYIPIRIPGLSWVERDIIYALGPNGERGEEHLASENGAPADCTLARGKGAYLGPDIMQTPTRLVVPGQNPNGHFTGTIKAYIGSDKKVWGLYKITDNVKDTENGKLIASSEMPPPPAPSLGISVADVPHAEYPWVPPDKRITLTLKAKVPGRIVWFETSEQLDGPWKAVSSSITDTGGAATFTLSVERYNLYTGQRFYRAKIN